jgi:hypothetical protein
VRHTSKGATKFIGTSTKTVNAPLSVAGVDTYSLVTNTTAVLPSMPTFLTLWASRIPKPGVSNLNAATSQIVGNATITDVGLNNDFNIYNDKGAVNVVVDVMGSMEYIPNTGPVTALLAAVGPRIWTGNALARSGRRIVR